MHAHRGKVWGILTDKPWVAEEERVSDVTYSCYFSVQGCLCVQHS